MNHFLFTLMNFDFPIIIGMTAAIVHVLMGPDHLAAVTPLVFDTQKRHWRIGFLWGIGHVVGMLLIGVLFYFFKDFIPIEAISKYSEQFVGLILIALGIWGFYRIKNKQAKHKHPHFHDKEEVGSMIHIHKHLHHSQEHDHSHQKNTSQNSLTAIGVGVIHGFAGVAHFVLLLPVLGFSSKMESLQYIIGFAMGIMLAMIIYTLIIGKFNKTNIIHTRKSLFFNLQFWSGVLAVIVGIYWLLMC